MKYLILYDNFNGLGLAEVEAPTEERALDKLDGYPNIHPLGLIAQGEIDLAKERRKSDLRGIGKIDPSNDPLRWVVGFRAAKHGWVAAQASDRQSGVYASDVRKAYKGERQRWTKGDR